MARESQGLQIALIATVMLVIILSVTTYVFFRQADEAGQKLVAAQTDVTAKQKDITELTGFVADLKKFVGFKDAQPRPECATEFNTDVTTYAAGTPDADYRKVIKQLWSTIKARSDEVDSLKAANDKLHKDLEAREGQAVPKLQAAQKKAKDVQEDLEKRTEEFQTARNQLSTEKDQIQAKWQASVKQTEDVIVKGRARIQEAQVRLERLQKVAVARQEQLDQVTGQVDRVEKPSGKVTWVNQRNGIVWINLGNADALSRLTSFSVYDAGSTDIGRAEKKAGIEVTQILGDHFAEAKILEDKTSAPIVPGDVIHTPIWSPGQQKHFAITGFIDLNGDGKSDLEALMTLIRANNGVVDAYMDENGAIRGKMNERTSRLIKGAEPSIRGEKSDRKREQVLMDNWNSMLNEANRLTIKIESLRDFLDRLGYRERNQVVQFGAGAPSGQFKITPGETKVPSSGAPVSPLFQPRQPPRSSAAGAY